MVLLALDSTLICHMICRLLYTELISSITIPKRQLGQTMVTIIGLGGAHISMEPASKDKSMAFQIVHCAIEHSINFLVMCILMVMVGVRF